MNYCVIWRRWNLSEWENAEVTCDGQRVFLLMARLEKCVPDP